MDQSGITLALLNNHWSNLHTQVPTICENDFSCLFSIKTRMVGFTKWPKDCVPQGLLDYPSINQISRLDKRKVPQHLSFVCSHKLYIKIVQPCDVILQWLSKCVFASYFKTWSTSNIQEQLESNTLGHEVDLQMDFLPCIHEMVLIWLWTSYSNLGLH